MCAITQSKPAGELFSHARTEETGSTPAVVAKASRQNLFSQPSTQDTQDADEVARPVNLPRNPFQV
jgi:hypothetical protein